MSLKSPAQNMENLRGLKDTRLHTAIVRENNDPEMKMRIKVEIPGLLEGAVDQLPWLLPKVKSPYGVGTDYGIVHIPVVGSKVLVHFQDGNLSLGVYESDVVTGDVQLHAELQTNYPNRLGFYTPMGDLFYMDLTTEDVLFRRKSGTAIKIDKDGNVDILCAKDFTQTVKGDYTLVVQGNMDTVVQGNASHNVKGNDVTAVGGKSDLNVSGAQTVMISGARTVSCSGEQHLGGINCNEDVVASGVSLKNHTHPGDSGGTTGSPN